MIRFWAIIGNTFREGIAKKTILTILVLSTLIIGFFLLALNVGGDIVYLFGAEIDELPEEALRGFEAAVVAFFYQISIFVGIFAVASFFPSMQEKGTIDLLLSRPMSRFSIYTAKFLGCMVIVFVVAAYTILGTWAIFWLKTGIAHKEYLYTIPIFMLAFFAFMGFIAMVGVITRSTTLSAILGIFFPFFFSLIFLGLHNSRILSGYSFWHNFFETLYWIFPKTPELTAWNIDIIAGGAIDIDPVSAIWSTLAFAVGTFVIGALIFQKRSY